MSASGKFAAALTLCLPLAATAAPDAPETQAEPLTHTRLKTLCGYERMRAGTPAEQKEKQLDCLFETYGQVMGYAQGFANQAEEYLQENPHKMYDLLPGEGGLTLRSTISNYFMTCSANMGASLMMPDINLRYEAMDRVTRKYGLGIFESDPQGAARMIAQAEEEMGFPKSRLDLLEYGTYTALSQPQFCVDSSVELNALFGIKLDEKETARLSGHMETLQGFDGWAPPIQKVSAAPK